MFMKIQTETEAMTSNTCVCGSKKDLFCLVCGSCYQGSKVRPSFKYYPGSFAEWQTVEAIQKQPVQFQIWIP